MRLPVFSRLILAVVLLSIPTGCLAGFDLSKLDSRIDLTLDDSSMSDAVFAISQLTGIDTAAPVEPASGLTASIRQETVREVLDTLAKISGLRWHIENTVIVFQKPITRNELPPAKQETVTPDEAMTSFLASMSDVQLFFVSRGVPLPYAELAPAQQEIIKAILAPSGSTTTSQPTPEQVAVAFRVMPALVVPKTSGGAGWTLRLDSMPYATLAGTEAK